ncbi:MAG TPA: monomethylamine:corrinoid methyltransferase [Anaerolineae bacterium]|nr:monomethylamine:corrinoid methyltransferase [Anaerolineae bacterium]
MIHSYLDILDRTKTGRVVKKSDWDMDYVVLPTKLLAKEYRLEWDNQHIIPEDEDLLDHLFQAGMELAASSGIYCITTGRVITFSLEELIKGIRRMPQSLQMGEGKDARWLYARKIMDERLPLVWAGNPGAPTLEEIFIPCVMSWMQEPVVDLATCGSITKVDGRNVETGSPLEIQATRRELRNLREALRRVGRPGMGLLAGQSAVTELGDLAISHPDYLRPVDSHLVALFNELIIDQINMARALNSVEYGMRNASLATVMVGGLGGDAPGAAIVQVASFILANWVCLADYHILHPIHIRHVATSTRGAMWLQSAVEQAFARNAPCIIVSDIYPKSGALTRELLYEVAANAIVITVSGGHLEGVGSADGLLPNGTGLEARWMGEVGHAVARQGLTLSQANQIVVELLSRYEHVFQMQNGNPGVRFGRAYDLKTLKPVPAWQQLYEEVKAEVRKMGLAYL